MGSLFAPWIAPHDPFDLASLNLLDSRIPPAWSEEGDKRFLLGTDDQGRDILSTIMYGSRISLAVGFASVVFAAVLGVSLGLLAGYFGGAVDSIIMRIADVQLTFPAILIALLIDGTTHALIGNLNRERSAFWVLVLSIGLSFWVQYARTVRGSTLVEKNKEYVQAARLIGIHPVLIMIRHVLPNVTGPVLVIATINLALAVITEATLSFLGVGIPPTQPSLGTMIRIGQDFLFSGEWWITFFPGFALAALCPRRKSARRLAARCAQPETAVRGMSQPVLTVQNLRVEFPIRRGALTAIDGVSFDIAPGEVLGVVGESGAGKSLTGSAIIGLLEPPGRIADGEIRLEGGRIDNLDPEQMRKVRGKRIGMVFQDPLTSLNPLYRIGEQLVETIQTHLPMSDSEARVHAIKLLEEVGIPAAEARLDAYPHQFSGGMRQRVVIALALAANPVLVIADEPTTALDVSVQAQIIALLKRTCAQHGASVMLITHDMGVIAETADRVAVMYAGRIVEIGPVRAVVKHARHPYTQGLMASIPSIASDADRLSQIEGSMPRLGAIPRGCAFHPRCPHATDRCAAERPELLPAGDTVAACWLYAEAEAET